MLENGSDGRVHNHATAFNSSAFGSLAGLHFPIRRDSDKHWSPKYRKSGAQIRLKSIWQSNYVLEWWRSWSDWSEHSPGKTVAFPLHGGAL